MNSVDSWSSTESHDTDSWLGWQLLRDVTVLIHYLLLRTKLRGTFQFAMVRLIDLFYPLTTLSYGHLIHFFV